VAKREIEERIDGQLAIAVRAPHARAQAAVDSVRNIARGIYPPLLAHFGLAQALRAQATRATVDVRLMGSAPRGTEAAEEAAHFACSEAIQNAAKHTHGTVLTISLPCLATADGQR
jgi:signal transduction histidine kinase